MSFRDKILAFEARANALNVPMLHLLNEAGWSETKWWRMKQKTCETWDETMDRILTEREAKK